MRLPSRLAHVTSPIQNGKSVLPGHMRIASELSHFGQTLNIVNRLQLSLVSSGLFFIGDSEAWLSISQL